MSRKTWIGQPHKVTVGTQDSQEAPGMDPSGVLTIPDGHTPESKAAMSDYIRKRKSGEIDAVRP